METVTGESGLSEMATDEVYNFAQLEKAKKFIADNTSGLLLKTAVTSWSENSLQPDSIARYEQFERNYRDNYFWKIVEEKEVLKNTARAEITNPPTEEQLHAI